MGKRSFRLGLMGLVATLGLVAAACAPMAPGGGVAPVNATFKATQITSNDSQDEVRDPLFGACIAIPNCNDEAYLIQVAFRVKIGQPGSAQAFVVTGDKINGLSEGETRALTGGQQAAVNFNGIQPLDVLDALNPSNKLEVFGTYTWAAEEDTINSLSGGANSVASIFTTALNGTLANASVPSDANGVVNLVLDALFDNFNTPFNLIVSNIPCLGLCDDVLGGSLHVGIGATGTLASVIDSVLATTTIPTISIPLVSIPPDIQGGGIYTLGSTKTFVQQYSGADGRHTYTLQGGPA